MKILIFALAFASCSYADVSELGYSYQKHGPAPAPVSPQNTYIPPTPSAHEHQPKNTYIPPAPPAHEHQPKKTYVPSAPPTNSYIPPGPAPVQQHKHTYIPRSSFPSPAPVEQLKNSYIPPANDAIEEHGPHGYRYKAIRRVIYKHRA